MDQNKIKFIVAALLSSAVVLFYVLYFELSPLNTNTQLTDNGSSIKMLFEADDGQSSVETSTKNISNNDENRNNTTLDFATGPKPYQGCQCNMMQKTEIKQDKIKIESRNRI